MADSDDRIDFDPSLIDDLDRRVQPLKRLLSPISLGCEHIPRKGPVLLTGNHSIYGLVDIPMLGLEIFEKTGRTVRGLADHNHFALPLWRDLLQGIGAVRGTRDICSRLFEAGEAVLVFPGGGREVMKHKHERYRLIWKERIGFARLAIQYGVPIVPFASVGVEDMFDIVIDAEDILRSPVGDLLRALGITEQPWFRHGEVIPPIARGRGIAALPRLERQYFLFGAPIDTTGAVYALFLTPSGTTDKAVQLAPQPGVLFNELNDNDRFGLAVAPLGDLDGDGNLEIAVAAPLDNDGTDDAGAFYVLNTATPVPEPGGFLGLVGGAALLSVLNRKRARR